MLPEGLAIAALILHGILAVFTLGALTHQIISIYWAPKPVAGGQSSFWTSVRAVRAGHYVNAVIILYLLTAILGSIVYANYRIEVRQFYLDEYKMYKANGLFELKEHIIALGVGLLPAYWYYWKNDFKPEIAKVRGVLSALLAFSVWFGFIIGHIINNIQGIGR
jgi:hypothetical protein